MEYKERQLLKASYSISSIDWGRTNSFKLWQLKKQKEGIVVKTGDGAVVLTEIKPFGKKRMMASSYVNGVGAKTLIGKVFE